MAPIVPSARQLSSSFSPLPPSPPSSPTSTMPSNYRSSSPQQTPPNSRRTSLPSSPNCTNATSVWQRRRPFRRKRAPRNRGGPRRWLMNEGNPDQRRGRRQVVKFSFYKVDPGWRALAPHEREAGKRELCATVEAFSDRLQVRCYSVVGMRGDADLLLWQIGDGLDDIQRLASVINGTAIGPYLTMPYSYLAMTRPSVYVSGGEGRERLQLQPGGSHDFFLRPLVQTGGGGH